MLLRGCRKHVLVEIIDGVIPVPTVRVGTELFASQRCLPSIRCGVFRVIIGKQQRLSRNPMWQCGPGSLVPIIGHSSITTTMNRANAGRSHAAARTEIVHGSSDPCTPRLDQAMREKFAIKLPWSRITDRVIPSRGSPCVGRISSRTVVE